MKNNLAKIIVVNLLITIVVLIAFYFIAFLSGFGSNTKYLPQEKRLFAILVILHFTIAAFLLNKNKQFNLTAIVVTLLAIVSAYLFAAWNFDYIG